MPGKLILIVEDEPENAEIIRTVVEDILGHRALMADNGQDALNLAFDQKPNLILMDLMMPVLNGFAAIQQLKGSSDAAIPVIALTALSRAKDQQMALEAGANDYISKPFDLDILSEKIERFVEPANLTDDEVDDASRQDDYDPT